jgi:hypothetical protein
MAPGIRITPKSGATSTKPHDARVWTVGTALGATTGDGLAANVGPMQERTVFNNALARTATREAWLLRTGRRHDPDDPDGRSSQMRSLFAGCRNRDRNAEVGPVAATCPTLAKQPGTATVMKCLNLPRMKKDPESFFLCPYNACGSPAVVHETRGRLVQPLVRRPSSA